jgi:ATP-dependent helicase/nuclease subunit A
MLHNYIKREPADLHSFLKWWDDSKEKQVIAMPENQEAMRLMTIHSSKGLEFPVVILPFADWEIMKKGHNMNYLWCIPNSNPLNQMDLLPVNMSPTLENTIFNNDYLREKALLYVDNLNLLYVAFTRAIRVLHIFIPGYNEQTVKNNIAPLISLAIKHQIKDITDATFPATNLPNSYDEQTDSFIFGEIPLPEKNSYSGNEWKMNNLVYPVRNISDVTQQVSPATGYFGNEGEKLSSHLQSGKVMHEIFQEIRTVDDIDKALLKAYNDGKISKSDQKKLKPMVINYINHPVAKKWFESGWVTKNENPIFLPDKSQVRPDRVLVKDNKAIVIDYKFGGEEKPGYINQVALYIKCLEQMGYAETEGYVWYVTNNKIIPVNTKEQQGTLF